jgi:hypothetical protein
MNGDNNDNKEWGHPYIWSAIVALFFSNLFISHDRINIYNKCAERTQRMKLAFCSRNDAFTPFRNVQKKS